jgi:hypothetical protein
MLILRIVNARLYVCSKPLRLCLSPATQQTSLLPPFLTHAIQLVYNNTDYADPGLDSGSSAGVSWQKPEIVPAGSSESDSHQGRDPCRI